MIIALRVCIISGIMVKLLERRERRLFMDIFSIHLQQWKERTTSFKTLNIYSIDGFKKELHTPSLPLFWFMKRNNFPDHQTLSGYRDHERLQNNRGYRD
jgi:hypothetical protein